MVLFFFSFIFLSQLLRSFEWRCSTDLLVRLSSSKLFIQFLGLYFRNCPVVFFYFLLRRIKIYFVSPHFAAFSIFGVKYFWLP